MTPLPKIEIIQLFLQQFEKEVSALAQSAKAAHEAATHEESKSEDKHDTRAIEASYLAAGQAARVAELEKVILEYRGYIEKKAPPAERIRPGCLVQLSTGGKNFYSFFAVLGGGTQVKVGDLVITVTIESSPLGEELSDSRVGDEVSIDTRNGNRDYEVVKID